MHLSWVNSPHKGQWRGALMFSLIFAWTNSWLNNRDAGDLRRHRAHYDVTVILCTWVRDNISWWFPALYRMVNHPGLVHIPFNGNIFLVLNFRLDIHISFRFDDYDMFLCTVCDELSYHCFYLYTAPLIFLQNVCWYFLNSLRPSDAYIMWSMSVK